MKRFALLCVLCVSVVSFSGCAAVHPSATNPGRKGTPQENAMAYNASIAQANNTIAQTVINATASTPPLIDVATANKILIAQSKIADADRQLTPLLADAAKLSANSAQIRKLVGDIQAATAGLQGDLGIKDAKTQQSVSTAISAIVAGAGSIIDGLTAAGLLK